MRNRTEIIIVVAILVAVAIAVMFRYKPMVASLSDRAVPMRYDRWTGKIEVIPPPYR